MADGTQATTTPTTMEDWKARAARVRIPTEALIETLDMGKPIGDSSRIDVPGAANCIAWFAEIADKIYDEIAPTDPSALAMITREPVGVVAAVVPWNFPLYMASWKVGPALAT